MYSYYCYACMEWYFKPSHQLKAKTIVHMCGSILGAPWVGEVWITWGAGWCLTHFLPWRGRGAGKGALRPAPLAGWASRTVPFWISAFRIVNAFVLALQPVSTKLLVMLSLCRSNNWLQWPHMLPCVVWTSFYSRINVWIGTCIVSCCDCTALYCAFCIFNMLEL